MVNAPLIGALREAFAAHADPARSGPMRAYMKSAMPFHGIAATQRRRLMAEAVAAHTRRTTGELGQTMQALRRGATHREQRYAAMELARVGPHRALLDVCLLPVYECMIVEGAWWDICDDISSEAIGTLVQRDPQTVKAAMRRCSTSASWRRSVTACSPASSSSARASAGRCASAATPRRTKCRRSAASTPRGSRR
jgi:hypothetical protein